MVVVLGILFVYNSLKELRYSCTEGGLLVLTYLKGSVIQSLRHRTGLSQIALAEIVNTVPAHISRFELGVRSPKEQSLGDIMTAINLPVETFFVRY